MKHQTGRGNFMSWMMERNGHLSRTSSISWTPSVGLALSCGEKHQDWQICGRRNKKWLIENLKTSQLTRVLLVHVPSRKLTWQWNITIFDRGYVFKRFRIFCCYVCFQVCLSLSQWLKVPITSPPPPLGSPLAGCQRDTPKVIQVNSEDHSIKPISSSNMSKEEISNQLGWFLLMPGNGNAHWGGIGGKQSSFMPSSQKRSPFAPSWGFGCIAGGIMRPLGKNWVGEADSLIRCLINLRNGWDVTSLHG